MLSPRGVWMLVKRALREWWDDGAPELAAAVAFYAMLSVAPLLIICIAVIGLVFGREAAESQIVSYLEGLMGPKGAAAAYDIIRNAAQRESGVVATVLSGITLVFSASGVFVQLHAALNHIWKVQPAPGRAIVSTIWARVFSFAMVVVMAFLMLLSLVVSTIITGLTEYAQTVASWMAPVGGVLDIAASLVVFTAMFGLVFKYIPDADIRWRDVRLGAAVTTVLFIIGKYVLGWYLSHEGKASIYGAAGSLVALLLWVYYTAQITFFGAELARIYGLSTDVAQGGGAAGAARR